MEHLTLGEHLFAAIRTKEEETLKGLKVSLRTIKVLQRNAVGLNRLYAWHKEGRKAFKRNLVLLDGIGPVRMREIARAINRRVD